MAKSISANVQFQGMQLARGQFCVGGRSCRCWLFGASARAFAAVNRLAWTNVAAQAMDLPTKTAWYGLAGRVDKIVLTQKEN